jgi:tetratricopeptide (TPR) repeat protein
VVPPRASRGEGPGARRRGAPGGRAELGLGDALCLASTDAAADRAGEALRLARLAVRIAEAAPGPESWRLRLRGWCELFLANVTRVGGDLTPSEEAFARADALWERGAAGDPAGLLDRARRLDLKASLLKEQGKFSEALDLLDQALAANSPREAARLLLMKASTLARAGDYERSLEVLRQAEPRLDARREPRQPFLHKFLLALNLLHLDLYPEAERLLPQVEALTDPHNQLDSIRLRWLQGRTWAGLGRRAEAFAALSEVRRYFQAEKIPYDFALVSLELAVLHLELGEARRVQELAGEMLWIFESQKVHQEALAALGLFCHAARAGEIQAEGTRRLVKFLYRAQHNPKLRFAP